LPHPRRGETDHAQSQTTVADDTSIVIHAKADDYNSQPAGNAGDRIACAVIKHQ
jgi:superoxide dismutase, Cu-Zn family